MKIEFWQKIWRIVWRWQNIGLLLLSVGLSFIVYISNNWPVPIAEEIGWYTFGELIKAKPPVSGTYDTLNPLYIDVSHDKQLIEFYDNETGECIGNTAITDRQKLLSLIKLLRTTGQYKYVFLDLGFEKKYKTEVDSALFAEISSMKRIVIPNDSEMDLAADSLLTDKAALDDYYTTIVETNFVRFQLTRGRKPTMPFYAYSEITGDSIREYHILPHISLYICGEKLCYNSLFVHFPIATEDADHQGSKRQAYEPMGYNILEEYDENNIAEFAELTKDRYVVIGDMEGDVHSTYVGNRPGPVIIFNAFRALMAGEHFVSIWSLVFLTIVFFGISLYISRYFSWYEWICAPFYKICHLFCRSFWKEKSSKYFVKVVGKPVVPIGSFLLSFIGYGTILMVVIFALNMFWNIALNVFIPTFLLMLMKKIVDNKK